MRGTASQTARTQAERPVRKKLQANSRSEGHESHNKGRSAWAKGHNTPKPDTHPEGAPVNAADAREESEATYPGRPGPQKPGVGEGIVTPTDRSEGPSAQEKRSRTMMSEGGAKKAAMPEPCREMPAVSRPIKREGASNACRGKWESLLHDGDEDRARPANVARSKPLPCGACATRRMPDGTYGGKGDGGFAKRPPSLAICIQGE